MHNNTVNILYYGHQYNNKNAYAKAECITSIITTSFHNNPPPLSPPKCRLPHNPFFPHFFTLKFFFHSLTLLSMSLPSSKPFLQQPLPSPTTKHSLPLLLPRVCEVLTTTTATTITKLSMCLGLFQHTHPSTPSSLAIITPYSTLL